MAENLSSVFFNAADIMQRQEYLFEQQMQDIIKRIMQLPPEQRLAALRNWAKQPQVAKQLAERVSAAIPTPTPTEFIKQTQTVYPGMPAESQEAYQKYISNVQAPITGMPQVQFAQMIQPYTKGSKPVDTAKLVREWESLTAPGEGEIAKLELQLQANPEMSPAIVDELRERASGIEAALAQKHGYTKRWAPGTPASEKELGPSWTNWFGRNEQIPATKGRYEWIKLPQQQPPTQGFTPPTPIEPYTTPQGVFQNLITQPAPATQTVPAATGAGEMGELAGLMQFMGTTQQPQQQAPPPPMPQPSPQPEIPQMTLSAPTAEKYQNEVQQRLSGLTDIQKQQFSKLNDEDKRKFLTIFSAATKQNKQEVLDELLQRLGQ